MKLFRFSIILFVLILVQKIAFRNWEFQFDFFNQIVDLLFTSTVLIIVYKLVSSKVQNKKILNLIVSCFVILSIVKIFVYPQKEKVFSKITINPVEEKIVTQADPNYYQGDRSNSLDSILIKKYFLIQERKKINGKK